VHWILSVIVIVTVAGGLVAGIRQPLLFDRSVERPSRARVALHVLMVGLVLVLALLAHTHPFSALAWAVGLPIGFLLRRRRRRSLAAEAQPR
jgi:hypothetical protein